VAQRDFYQVLGVPDTASQDEIKKAYRRLAKQYNPDANPNNTAAAERFKEISEAHTVLADADKRTLRPMRRRRVLTFGAGRKRGSAGRAGRRSTSGDFGGANLFSSIRPRPPGGCGGGAGPWRRSGSGSRCSVGRCRHCAGRSLCVTCEVGCAGAKVSTARMQGRGRFGRWVRRQSAISSSRPRTVPSTAPGTARDRGSAPSGDDHCAPLTGGSKVPAARANGARAARR
jgi:curved DNA-binding protein CbpA